MENIVNLNNTFFNADKVDAIRLYINDEYTKENGRAWIVADLYMTDGRHRQILIDSCRQAERKERLNHWRDDLAARVSGVWKYEIKRRGANL